jgi:hypothetical protein
MKRLFAVVIAMLLLVLPGVAFAKKDSVGTRVYIQVVDENQDPVRTAVIRHPDEGERHRVNSVDGTWDDEVLYMPDGSELVFAPGLILVFEVSAPGYETQVVQYQVRRRRNTVQVVLKELDLDEDELEEPMMSFGRDTPREDATGSGPAN